MKNFSHLRTLYDANDIAMYIVNKCYDEKIFFDQSKTSKNLVFCTGYIYDPIENKIISFDCMRKRFSKLFNEKERTSEKISEQEQYEKETIR